MSIARREKRWVGAGIVMAALLALVPALASGQTTQYSAQLTGANEVPATDSTATGTFTATLDEGAKTLSWSLTVPAITDATMAHIHAGAAGVNGGIVVTLFMPGSPAGSVSVSGTAGPADLGGPLAGNWDGFVSALKSGGLYVNVHTTAHPSGEIRAQIMAAGGQGTPTATATGIPTATATATATPTRTATPTATATMSPAPPKTGQAGLVDESDNSGAAVVLVLIAVGVVAGGRLMTSRNR
jgi:hypothetical protein